MNQEIFSNIFQLVLTGGIGVVGFFLKRTISELDECKREVYEVKSNHTLSSGLEKCKEEISYIKENYASCSAMEACKKEVAEIKENYTTREELFREQAAIRRKLDRIMDILLDIKGEKKA